MGPFCQDDQDSPHSFSCHFAATEAEPKADADPYLVYGGYPYTGLTHGLTYGAYHPYYTLPVVKAAEAEVKAADEDETKKVLPLHCPISDGYPYTYGHLPYYTHPVVTKKVVKAADGEEKTVVPTYALPYGGLYNYGYGYSGYPVVKTVATGKTVVSPLHHNWGYYGKRSADAEPAADADADADPWLAYGHYGYGHGLHRPYGYGYRSYYGGYPYGGYRTYGYPYYG